MSSNRRIISPSAMVMMGLLAAANLASAAEKPKTSAASGHSLQIENPLPQLPEDIYVPPVPAPKPQPPKPDYKPNPAPPPKPSPDYPLFKPVPPPPAPGHPDNSYVPEPATTPSNSFDYELFKPADYKPDQTECDKQNAGFMRYKKGYTQGKMVFGKSYKFLHEDCNKLDTLYDSLKSKCPFKEICQKDGYLDAVEDCYMNAQDSCIADCAGAGEDTGNMLGTQFCNLAQGGPAAAMAQESPTVQICNAVESTLCYSSFDDYVQQHCADAMDANMDYYNSLSEVCAITNRRR